MLDTRPPVRTAAVPATPATMTTRLDTWLRPGPDARTWRARAVYRVRTHVCHRALACLPWLARLHARVTVRDLYSTPGDTLLTATLCRHIKRRFPTLRLNVVTRHPDLLAHDPHVTAINRKPGWLVIDFWYVDLQARKDRITNVLAPAIERLGVGPVDYRARVYLTPAELADGRARVARLRPPLISISTLSAQPVKNWPRDLWKALIPALSTRGSLVHLGDAREPELPVAMRVAGALSMRESMAVVAACAVHIGPDSFLMHAANGLDVPSVIIFGGSRTPASLGYAANHNLFAELPCSGCWLTGHPGDECLHGLSCQLAISPRAILAATDELLSRGRAASPTSRAPPRAGVRGSMDARRVVPSISAYVPCFNDAATVGRAVASLAAQTVRAAEIFVVDDGSTDDSVRVLRNLGVCVIRHEHNLGRGAARLTAMRAARYELVLSCDATGALEPGFLEKVLHWFDDPRVAAVFGRLTQAGDGCVAHRWRARHLFRRSSARHAAVRGASLATSGAVVRAASVEAAGNYDPRLRHTEDRDLGIRLIASGHDVVSEPRAEILALADDTVFSVLERHWRWNAGQSEHVTWRGYARNAWYALKVMARADVRAGDVRSVPISLLAPHYAFWRSWWRRRVRSRERATRTARDGARS